MGELEEDFSRALFVLSRSWRTALGRRLKDLGLGQTGWMAIASIAREPSDVSQTDLAAMLTMETASVVTLVDRLAKMGLVERVPCGVDRRVKYVKLTACGLAMFAQVDAVASVFRMEILKDCDQEEMGRTVAFLSRLQSNLDQL